MTTIHSSLLLFLFACKANAAFISLVDSSHVGLPGDTVSFSGVLSNTGPSTVYLNGTGFVFSSLDVVIDDGPFFAFVPAILVPGGSYSGVLFNAIISTTAVPGNYTGAFSTFGGSDLLAFGTLDTQRFEVVVGNVPEPRNMAEVGCGILLLVIRSRRSRRHD